VDILWREEGLLDAGFGNYQKQFEAELAKYRR
jgi:hypothetical protein